MRIIDGRKIRDEIILELSEKIKRKLTLAVLSSPSNEASTSYVKGIRKISEKLKVEVKEYILEKHSDFESKIEELNKDKKINGILLLLPLPEDVDFKKLQKKISPEKDVEGISPLSFSRFYSGEKKFAPIVSLSVLEIIKRYKINIKNKTVGILGHSPVIGRPISILLLQEFVFSHPHILLINIGEKNFKKLTKISDLLIVAVGKPEFLKKDMIKKGSTIVDIGINFVNGKIKGDVHFEDVKNKVSLITPVPGGVGPVVNAILFKKLFLLSKIQKDT